MLKLGLCGGLSIIDRLGHIGWHKAIDCGVSMDCGDVPQLKMVLKGGVVLADDAVTACGTLF